MFQFLNFLWTCLVEGEWSRRGKGGLCWLSKLTWKDLNYRSRKSEWRPDNVCAGIQTLPARTEYLFQFLNLKFDWRFLEYWQWGLAQSIHKSFYGSLHAGWWQFHKNTVWDNGKEKAGGLKNLHDAIVSCYFWELWLLLAPKSSR